MLSSLPVPPRDPSRPPLPVLGWREWAALPGLGAEAIKIKVDTGARSSALHAFGLPARPPEVGSLLTFEVHPAQRSARGARVVEAEVVDVRWVRSSTGTSTLRPVIRTPIHLGDLVFPIEITLVRRDVMGFRMLLGRRAIRRRFLVDPGRSFLLGRRPPGAPPETERTSPR